jgi:dTDP-4-amino-4,6-dideoxygalactose transaminase
MPQRKKIPFNKPPYLGSEGECITVAMQSDKLSGDGQFSLKCHNWFEKYLPTEKALLTPSCTHALELAALLIDIKPNDEVIMPSYTFVSTANAFVMRGAKISFVDIRPDTMNIDEKKIESAITPKTRAIVPVHYAGVSCEMNVIMNIAEKHNLYVIEDAAQAIGSIYHGNKLGSIGHLSAFSFHETKNITSGGEGGLLAVNDKSLIKTAEIMREKGTNRSQFFRGDVDKYTWLDIGSSYLPSEIQAAYLWNQLEKIDEILSNRLQTWSIYKSQLQPLVDNRLITIPTIPSSIKHNGHMFYFKVRDLATRTSLLEHLRSQNIHAVFHYIPLHSSPAGLKYGQLNGEDEFTTIESEKLIRLPIFYNLEIDDVNHIIKSIFQFFNESSNSLL